MKRHESLASLSREHHPSLLLAQLLKKDAPAYKGMPVEPASKALYAFNFFHSSIQEHFRKEEQVLQKVVKFNKEIEKLAGEIIQEHQELTIAFLAVQTSVDLVNNLDILGRKLEQHIRKEERILFPLIEQYCPEEILSDIMLLLK
ncbi:MAG: hemerythrin domain-containing protein [Chitinophagaceae bacterium]